jgi:hypothetical protein
MPDLEPPRTRGDRRRYAGGERVIGCRPGAGGYSLGMVIAASTLWTIVFAVVVIVLGLLGAAAFRAPGDAAARGMTPLGAKLPDSPEMRRPPEEGGPR